MFQNKCFVHHLQVLQETAVVTIMPLLFVFIDWWEGAISGFGQSKTKTVKETNSVSLFYCLVTLTLTVTVYFCIHLWSLLLLLCMMN